MVRDSDNDERRFQKKLAWEQIRYGGLITIGATFFAVGATLILTSWSLFPNITSGNEPEFFSSLMNLFGNLALVYSIIGVILIGIGSTVPRHKYGSLKNPQLLVPTISIRNFSPRTYGVDDLEKKKELREKITEAMNYPTSFADACRGKLLSLHVCFYLHKEKETGSPRDLDNMLKLLCDTFPDYLDRGQTEKGLGLISGNSDHTIHEIHCTKKLVDNKTQEGMDMKIFEYE